MILIRLLGRRRHLGGVPVACAPDVIRVVEVGCTAGPAIEEEVLLEEDAAAAAEADEEDAAAEADEEDAAAAADVDEEEAGAGAGGGGAGAATLRSKTAGPGGVNLLKSCPQ
jgi:hypothetical protein